ncbi:MAG: hypothetical protein ACRCUY_00175 [Thermoguttaceae bacterium]
MKRRVFLKTGLVWSAVASCHLSSLCGQATEAGKSVNSANVVKAVMPGVKDLLVPMRQITHQPGFHWFGYYDKLQFDPTSRFVLGMRTDIDKRAIEPTDRLEIGMIDLENDFRWKRLGETTAWSWQQGCMLQWIPGSSEEVLWNDREADQYVCRICNVRTGAIRTLPKAIYALSPDGKWGVGTEFSRIDQLRPGYGYVGITDPYFDVKAPDEIGIDRIDLETGESQLIVSLGELARIPHNGEDVSNNFHWFNHLLVNTDGTRITFLNRWRPERQDRQTMAATGWTTRMFTLNPDGSDPYIINSSGFISHFVWADPNHIAAFVRANGKDWRLYLLEDKTGTLTPIGFDQITADGHNTFIPGTANRWILNDTYPDRTDRHQTLYVYDCEEDRRINLGRFFEPPEFTREWRVDLHARTAPDGKKIVFDSTHTGERQMFLLSLGDLFGEPSA